LDDLFCPCHLQHERFKFAKVYIFFVFYVTYLEYLRIYYKSNFVVILFLKIKNYERIVKIHSVTLS